MKNGRRIINVKKRILSAIIKKMEPRELYAFVTATIIDMSRQSGISTDDILSAVMHLIEIMKENENVR